MSFNDDYMKLRRKRLGEYYKRLDEKEDIAPVKSTVSKNVETENDNRWLKSGAFDDGYDFGDLTKSVLATSADLGLSIAEGVSGLVEGVSDLILYGAAGITGLVGGDNSGIKKVAQHDTVREAFSDFKYVTDIEDNSFFGDTIDSIGQGIGQVATIIATGGIAGAAGAGTAGASAITTGLIGTSSMGSGMSEAYHGGATDGEAFAYGTTKGVIDAGTELIFGGLGKAVKAVGLSKGITSIDDVLAKKLGNVITKNITNESFKRGLANIVEYSVKASAEGAEEVIAGYLTAHAKKGILTPEEDFNKILQDENLFEQFVVGAVTSGIMQSGYLPETKSGSLRESIETGRDFIDGLTANEQTVLDKEVERRIAEAEQDGKELSKKEKNKIYDQAQEDLKKGYISTDTIESVLGGDTYKSYQDTVSSEEALIKEYEELRKMKKGEMNDIQEERLAELKAMNLSDTSKRDSLKAQLSEEVYGQLTREVKGKTQTDNYLLESYNERTRRGQVFEADLSKYDEKQATVIQKAIDSGILNNTNRTHEFVDMIAKISADKGVLFDFANNERIKNSGFAVDGNTVNGYVTKDGITLNIQSAKALNTVVGHEITHVLEGTELYTALQESVIEYAKAKGEYDGRYKALEELYKNVKDADINAELTADLVGDYLFTDQDFVNNLSVKHRNVFQKIYDEIKYLYKVATAGSKEARELEKVKRAFDKAYRESENSIGDTKYSLTGEKTIDKYTQKQYNDFGWASENNLLNAGQRANFNTKFATVVSGKNISPQTKSGEYMIAVSDIYDANNEGIENTIVYARGTIEEPIITRILQIDADNETDLSEARREVYEIERRGIQQETIGIFRRYNSVDFTDARIEQNGLLVRAGYNDQFGADRGASGGKAKETVSYRTTKQGHKVYYSENDIAPINKASSTDGVFFDGKKRKYSLSDSDGKKLTTEQTEYFKDSKMRDDNGNLMVMYHGSQDAGFHVFDSSMSDDDTSFFFVDRNDVAASYSGTTETYEAQTIRTAEDMNKFIESIDAEGYEVVEKDGKFTLLYEGDRVADSNTAQGIYNEFCWYEGVGEGDANYKVYLNLKNPLVVNAEGRNWNNISREFSQEIADRYNSLTAEEKAALSNLAEWGEYSIFKDEMLDARAAAEQGVSSGYGDVAFTKTLARAYQKLGGANANLYDAFSIASDNFSEESIKEFAVKQMNTRDYAQRAKKQGYDGVIFKNIHDNGGYSNGSEGASTVAIAFESNQIKSVANEKPTGDPDIRYSLTEYTAEEKKAHNDAVIEHFGKTYNWAETGYLLLDGTKLDLSGKHDGAPGGYRTVDHRDITEALGYDYGGGGYSDSLVQFMSEGNIRIVPEVDGFNLSVKPTKAQEEALGDYISRRRGEVVVDIDDLNGNTVVSVEYPRGTYYKKILNDIREWFDNGKKPEVSGLSSFRSLTKEGEAPKRYGNFNVSGEDIALEAPIQEDIAETKTPTEESTEAVADFAPISEEEVNAMFPNEPNLHDLERESNSLEAQLRQAVEAKDVDTVNKLLPQYDELQKKIKQMRAEENALNSEALESLDDTDAPPEVEAPYYEDDTPIDPFEERDMRDVGNRKVNAYMYENPEVKPFFQQEANVLLGELKNDTVKGERFYTEGDQVGEYGAESYGHWTGVKRHTTPDIEYLLDNGKGNGTGYTYDEIEKGLNAIIEDNGKENNACSKRIEFIIHDRLSKGYQDGTLGFDVPANQDYLNLIKEKQITEYNEEARKHFFEHADEYAPMSEDFAPIAENKTATAEETSEIDDILSAPIYEEPTAKQESKTAEVLTEEPETPKEKGRLWSRFKTNFVDKGSVFEKLSLKTKNRELMSKWNYTLYSEARAQRLMGNGTEGVKSLNDIRAEVEKTGRTKEFYEYLYHKHNVDRMSLESKAEPTIKSLKGKFGHLKISQIRAIAAHKITEQTTERTAQTVREAKEYLNAIETKNKPVFSYDVTAEQSQEIVDQYEKANPNFKAYAQDVYDYMNYLRGQMVESGVISQETADLWANMYPHYVPIRRLGDSGLAVNVPLDTGKTGINAPIKRATGGNRDILPLFDTMAMRTEQTYRAIARNNFGVELKNTLGTTFESAKTNLDEIFDNVDKHEELLQKGENGRSPTFTVFENGEKVTFEITEEMYEALMPTSEGLKTTVKPLNAASKWHKGVLTEYNPVFMATNAIKDAQDILINSQHPAQTYKNLPKAFKELTTKGKWYTEYMNNGGEQNTYFDGQTKTFKAEDKGFVKAIGMPLRAISAANNFIERAPRLAEYIASREAGASVETAMLDSARVTTNFAAGGDVTKFLDRNGATFLNASVQGFNQQVRNVREAKANGFKGWLGLAAKVAVAGLPAILLNNLVWDDDEDYEELSDYVKDNYYVVAKYGDGQFVRIPKGRTVSVIQNAIEQIGNSATGDDEVDFNRFVDLFVTNLAPNNPLDNNILSPFVDVAQNEAWYGGDLVPTRLQDLPAAEQYDESTDSFSKWLAETPVGKFFNWSPYKINYLLDQYSGGVGDMVLPMMTPEAKNGGLLAPLMDKFTTDSVMKNQNITDFYDTVDELTVNANSRYATDEDILKYKYINSVSAELGELYAQKREIQNSSMGDSAKLEAVRDIQKQIDSLAKESINSYNSVSIDGNYATVGDRHYRWYEPSEDSEAEAGWQKITDKQLEKQEKVTSRLGIDPATYWSNKEEYDYAYDYPEKYAVAKAVGGYSAFKNYSSELYDIKADKDKDGKSISGSRKEKVIDYINELDADYGEKIILFKSEYNADDTYNEDILEYLNSREDISYEEMIAILKELGFTIGADGVTVTW